MHINTVIGGLLLALVITPLGVGYATAPCDAFGEPVVLSPYRLRQQRYLDEAGRWLDAVAEVGATLDAVAHGPQPAPHSVGSTFRLAEQVGQAASRLDALALPEAPAEYSLLALTLAEVRDTTTYAAERLLVFYGSADPQALVKAQAALDAASLALSNAREGIDGLTYPLCRDIWRGEQ